LAATGLEGLFDLGPGHPADGDPVDADAGQEAADPVLVVTVARVGHTRAEHGERAHQGDQDDHEPLGPPMRRMLAFLCHPNSFYG